MVKKEKFVKLSIYIREETQKKIDKKRKDLRRSRSAMIDILCSEALEADNENHAIKIEY